MADIYKAVGRQIRALREDKGLTQEKFAEVTGLHRSHVGEIERGETNVTLGTLHIIGSALGVPIWAVLKNVGVRTRGRN